MKSFFITIRFDRMKNVDLMILYHNIIEYSKLYTTNERILNALKRLETFEKQSNILDRKIRRKPHTEALTQYRARMDELTMAVYYQLKARKHAALVGDIKALMWLESELKKQLKGYQRKMLNEKDLVWYWFTHYNSQERLEAYKQLGMMPYLDEIHTIYSALNELDEQQQEHNRKQPAPYSTLKQKAKIISEIRFYLLSIDMQMHTNPIEVEEKLVKMLNSLLTSARAQLRNVETRRKRKKEKDSKNSADEPNTTN